jgi:predicted transposase/invertase (TIGR01784 family)
VNLQGGQETYIYLLFEHKSYPDPLISWQLLRYMVRIWERSLKQQESLLPIVPMVIYHGQKKWQVALNLAASFELPDALKPYVPDYQYWLCDLSQYSDEQIKGQVILQVGLRLLKYIWQNDLQERLGNILGLLGELSERQTALEYLETILRYISRRTDNVSEETLKQVVVEIFSEGEELMPTLVEQWIERGRIEGREEGREAALNLLRRFLNHRFGTALDHFDPDFELLDLAAITHLSDTVFEVNTLAEFKAVLAELKAKR